MVVRVEQREQGLRETASMPLMNLIVLALSEAGRERHMGLEEFRMAELMRERGRRRALYG